MSRGCPKCTLRSAIIYHGKFIRPSDKKSFQRFKCLSCKITFSQATFQSCYRQKKRRLNATILKLLCSSNSQRRIALLLNINRKTVARKLAFLANRSRVFNSKSFKKLDKESFREIQFDDLETFEHSKCKPLSVTMAVEKHSRRILGFNVSQMPAKGHLSKIALKKYGYREDFRALARDELFKRLTSKVPIGAVIESDDNPHYKPQLKLIIPQALHRTYLGKRGAIVGQGELKKIHFDPLFSLNHTFAMLRANINRLVRKTWCTTKRADRLLDHLEIYVHYHNEFLIKNPAK